MTTYGTLHCTTDGSERSGYYQDRPHEDQKFVLHCEPEQGVVLLPRVFNVSRVPTGIREARETGGVKQGALLQPGDWVFDTPFGHFILREYHREQPCIA